MEYEVSVQIAGEDVHAGTLFVHVRRGVESASFKYGSDYLADARAFPLAPDLPLVEGAVHSQGEPMFRAFGDGYPRKRWGPLFVSGIGVVSRGRGKRARC